MKLTDRLHWKQVYWVNGPTKHGQGIGLPARGEPLRETARPVYAVQDPPTSGRSHAFVIVASDEARHVTLFCPYSLRSFSVPRGCAEVAKSGEPTEWRRDFMVTCLTRNWEDSAKLNLQGIDLDTAAMVLKELGAPIPTAVLSADGSSEPKERGGKAVEQQLKKPVKRKSKRGDFLAWFIEGGNARPVREAMAHFGMTRSNVLSYLFILQKDHGIGYSLSGDLATVQLPEGVTDPFEKAEG